MTKKEEGKVEESRYLSPPTNMSGGLIKVKVRKSVKGNVVSVNSLLCVEMTS